MLQLMPAFSKWSIPAKWIIPHVLPIVLTALAFPITGSGNSSVFPKRPTWGSKLSWGHEWAELYVISTIRPHSVHRANLPFLPSSVFKDSVVPVCRGSLLQTISKESVGADTACADRTATVIMCCTVVYVNETYTRPTECQWCDRQTDRQTDSRLKHSSTQHFVTPTIIFHSAPTFFSGSLDRVFLSSEEAKGRVGRRGAKTVKFAFLTP